jgi:hypothetical protein
MNRLFFISLIIFCSVSAIGQEIEAIYDITDDYVFDSTVYHRDYNPKEAKKLQFNTQVGLGYQFSSAGYGGPVFSLSPYLTYPVGKRFYLNAGVSFHYANFLMPGMGENGIPKMLPMTRMFLYASGNYLVNERLIVNGTVYKQVMDVPNRNPVSSQYKYNAQGASIGFEYKLTPNIRVGAQITIEQPGFSNPYAPGAGRYGTGWW